MLGTSNAEKSAKPAPGSAAAPKGSSGVPAVLLLPGEGGQLEKRRAKSAKMFCFWTTCFVFPRGHQES